MEDRITALAAEIRYHQDRYYNDQPEIPDAEFDALWDELRGLAPEHPLFSEIGGDHTPGFEKRIHLMPMGSQEKASTPEQFRKWAQRINHSRYIVQYKLDGASIELQYENGHFAYGVTRGDGIRGDDISRNVRKMRGVPLVLDRPFSGAVRGEVIMEHEIHRLHYADKANCRNAANGLMKRKDGVGAEHLLIMCYDAHGGEDHQLFRDEAEKLVWLQERGFTVVPYRICSEAEEVIRYRDLVAEERERLPFDIDGLVVKGPDIDLNDMKRSRPQQQIAFKFSAEEALTVLREVEWSESGHLYTPVGIVDPVRLAGTTVRRASLVHPELIAEMGLQLGSEVVIVKRGDIIPKIERLVRHLEPASAIEVPSRCSTCGTSLINEGKRLYCPNPTCPRRAFHRIRKWLNVLEIRDFGDVLLGKLFDSGTVQTIADLYHLKWEDIAAFDGLGEVSARKALENLRNVSVIPLARFIAGFDIGGVAELKVRRLVDAGFNTLEKLRAATVEEMAAAEGIAEITAQQISDGLLAVAGDIDALLATSAVSIEAPTRPGEGAIPLEGLSFCFTGALTTMSRSEAEKVVREKGGEVRSSVTARLSYLVTNEPESSSSKNRKARELKVPIISEEQFLALAGGIAP